MATMVLLSVVAVEPALAQSNPVCSDDSGTLVDMIEGFVQLTTALGVMGLLVVWQADSLMEMFTLPRATGLAQTAQTERVEISGRARPARATVHAHGLVDGSADR